MYNFIARNMHFLWNVLQERPVRATWALSSALLFWTPQMLVFGNQIKFFKRFRVLQTCPFSGIFWISEIANQQSWSFFNFLDVFFNFYIEKGNNFYTEKFTFQNIVMLWRNVTLKKQLKIKDHSTNLKYCDTSQMKLFVHIRL